MNNFFYMKKVCNFYVSTTHLSTMIVPFLSKQLDRNVNIITFLQYNLSENINMLLDRLILNNDSKEKILKIDWNSTNLYKYSSIEKRLKNSMYGKKENIILIAGDEKKINFVNEEVNKFIEKNRKKLNNKNIKIINCFEVSQFNNSIVEILNNHEYILNTSGEYLIEEYFNGFSKNKKTSILD